jgi:uncharacterized protein YlxP (DUF503 family)
VHPVHSAARGAEELLAHELRPADHECHVRCERSDRRDGLRSVDVRGLDELRSEAGGDAVERALARPSRLDGAGERDDAHDLRTRCSRRLEAVAADDVEADPDRPQGAGNTRRSVSADSPRRSRFNARMAFGFVGIYSFELHFPASHSLKEKRMHLRSVKAQLANRVSCSIAEVDHHDTWQRARLTLACVARDASEAERLLDTAERWLVAQDFELLGRERELVSLGD